MGNRDKYCGASCAAIAKFCCIAFLAAFLAYPQAVFSNLARNDSLGGSIGDSTPHGSSYMLIDNWSGSWCDAEKTISNTDDDLMCWAAAASNVLEWSGWGKVGGMTNTDNMFAYFQDHWTDQGGLMKYGWDWWFDGTNDSQDWPGWSQVDPPGGGFYPARNRYTMFVIFVLLPIAIGTAIYVGWRSPSLLVFDWMATCGITSDSFRPAASLPESILYSLPDGCWVFAGTSWMLLIWRRLHPWVFIFVALGLGGEFGQAIQIVPGTFDWNDIVYYVGGFILATIGVTHAQTLFVNNRSFDYGRTCGGQRR